MEKFNFDGPSPEGGKRKLALWDILTIVILVGTLCIGGYFLMVFINPYSGLNVLSPSTPITPLALPTETATLLGFDATWTPTDTPEPSATVQQPPTWTPIWTNTPIRMPGVRATATRTRTPVGSPRATGMPFTSTITYLASTVIYPDLGCNWLGVGGTVDDVNNTPIIGMIIHLNGSLNGQTLEQWNASGANNPYGRSGYEFVLGQAAVSSTGTLWVQLVDQAGLPLSEKVTFNTYADCQRNLILIRFKKVR